MTIRLVAGFLIIFAAGLIATSVEAFARSGVFVGRHATAVHQGFRAPISRSTSFHHGFHAPIIRPAIARSPRVAIPAPAHKAPFAHFRHRHAPAVVFVGAPWYSRYDEMTYVAPDEQTTDSTIEQPSTVFIDAPTVFVESRTRPAPATTSPRLGCKEQTYTVPSEDGGQRPVKIVRCRQPSTDAR